MRKDQLQLLDNIDKLTLSQIYLLETPHSPQQELLHLFGHRLLITRNMFHRNLDRIRLRLPGSFAQAALQTAVLSCLVENQVDCTEESAPLLDLIQGWVNYYPALRTTRKEKRLLADAILQEGVQGTAFGGFAGYLTYLNIISVDLWRLLRNKKNQQQFLTPKPVREDLKEAIEDRCGQWLDANDLLTFISGCIPKTLLNVILTADGLPADFRKRKNLECLYSNQAVEYFLRRYNKLGLLLRQTLIVLVTMELSAVQQKFLMLVTMRYFYVYHFDRQYAAPELVVHAFNKLSEEVKRQLGDQFSLFFKIILKLGKHKFTNFVAQNSVFARNIVQLVMKKPMIGYPQESANPYNTANVAEVIEIQRGATVSRTFEVLQDHSIFYFRIEVASLDITVRLIYLGQIASTKEVRKVLFTNERVEGQLKSSVNAARKGLYRFEFDNSSSWINGKKIIYENQVFTPLEIKSNTMDDWLDDFYSNIPLNELANQEDILVAESRQNREKEDRKEREGESAEGVAVVTKREGLLRVAIKSRGQEFTYETDSLERMVQRVNQLSNSKEKYRWQVSGKIVQNFSQVENYLRGEQTNRVQEEREQKRQEKRQKKQEKINLQDYKDQAEEETQYEVTQKAELQRSQIINEDTSSTSLSKPAPEAPPSKKQTISYSSEQLQEAG